MPCHVKALEMNFIYAKTLHEWELNIAKFRLVLSSLSHSDDR